MPSWWPIAALIGSAILNVVLLVAVFFKSALNEIVKERYKAHRERKERERGILLELNERMHTFNTNYFMGCVWGVTHHNAATQTEKDSAAAQLAQIGGRTQDTLTFFARHDLEFPHTIRTLIGELRRAMVFRTVNGAFDGQEILARSAAVNEAVNRIMAHVQELVGHR